MVGIETWPTARIATLKTMHAAGKSGSVIAAQLSKDEGVTITRCAVIGKIYRLNLPKRVQAELSPEEIKTEKYRRRQKRLAAQKTRRRAAAIKLAALRSSNPTIRQPRAEKIRMEDIQETAPLNLTLDDLTMRDGRPVECRFITNDDMTTALYCGHPVDFATSWCPHHRMKLQPPKGWIGPKYVPQIACAA